jgi:hypothetical protein
MFIQVFIGTSKYVLLNINHIVSIDFYGSGSIITLSTKETIECTDNPSSILEQVRRVQSL